MKYLVASDIHGSAYYLRQLVDCIEKEAPDRILLLGDLLYHGPRNDLPLEYNPKECIKMLNSDIFTGKVLCVRGNCDAEVDQMVINFPIMSDYAIISLDKRSIYATHGHIWGENNPPKLLQGDFLLNGHTHIPACQKYENFTYVNPGSVSIPKEDSWHGYMIITDSEIIWKDLSGKVKKELYI